MLLIWFKVTSGKQTSNTEHGPPLWGRNSQNRFLRSSANLLLVVFKKTFVIHVSTEVWKYVGNIRTIGMFVFQCDTRMEFCSLTVCMFPLAFRNPPTVSKPSPAVKSWSCITNNWMRQPLFIIFHHYYRHLLTVLLPRFEDLYHKPHIYCVGFFKNEIYSSWTMHFIVSIMLNHKYLITITI